jgi:hypothetical protein
MGLVRGDLQVLNRDVTSGHGVAQAVWRHRFVHVVFATWLVRGEAGIACNRLPPALQMHGLHGDCVACLVVPSYSLKWMVVAASMCVDNLGHSGGMWGGYASKEPIGVVVAMTICPHCQGLVKATG